MKDGAQGFRFRDPIFESKFEGHDRKHNFDPEFLEICG